MNHPQAHIRTFLLAEFRTRCEEEIDYNLKTYAKDIGLTPSQLSEILAGKHRLTIPKAKKIAECLHLREEEYKALLGYIKEPNAKEDECDENAARTKPLTGMERRAFEVASKWVPALRDPKFLQQMAAWQRDREER